MNFRFICLMLIVVFAGSHFSSCKKENTVANNNTSQDPFAINFDLDGVAQAFEATLPSTTGGSSTSPLGYPHRHRWTGSFITDNTTSTIYEIDIYFGKDSIVEADFMGLVGTKLPVGGECNDPNCISTAMRIYQLGGSGIDARSYSFINTFPGDFVEIDAVAFHSTNLLGVKMFEVSGSFNLNIADNIPSPPTQAVTNGKFKLLFPELIN